MTLRMLGEHPFARDGQGRLKSRIATIFPRAHVLVTLPGIHATQRWAFADFLNAERRDRQRPPLTDEEFKELWAGAVDLIIDEDDTILIRPDPQQVGMMFEADEALQQLVSARQIRFLYVQNEKVRQAVKRRGECWRITPLPKSPAEIQAMIRAAKLGIQGRDIYYYNKATGTRWLTCQEFTGLGALGDVGLRQHLKEIQQHCGRTNAASNLEVDFFLAGRSFAAQWAALDLAALDAAGLRERYRQFRDQFAALVPPGLRLDDFHSLEWRRAMFAALLAREEDVVSEEMYLGLGAEFYMQIEWLPGGRIENGKVIFDPVFEEGALAPDAPGPPCDLKARAFILNFLREFSDLEYVNVGRVVERLSRRPRGSGRRDVYVVEMKQRGSEQEIVKIIRLQKWGVWERLDEGQDLLRAIVDSDEYTEYVLDRRLGCRQLGMRLPARVIPRKLIETYTGHHGHYHGRPIWSPYFERDYVHGLATDKIPLGRFADPAFALRFATLLGQAAAPNIIVGRCQWDLRVFFDDGDELLIEDPPGQPLEIVVSDHTGSFTDYKTDLEYFARQYAAPVLNRAEHLPDRAAFADAYVAAFLDSFTRIQEQFRSQRTAFWTLFKGRPWDEHGSFAFRWEKVLERLDHTDPVALARRIREHAG